MLREGDHLPNISAIVRRVSAEDIIGNEVSSDAFKLKPKEDYLSHNYLNLVVYFLNKDISEYTHNYKEFNISIDDISIEISSNDSELALKRLFKIQNKKTYNFVNKNRWAIIVFDSSKFLDHLDFVDIKISLKFHPTKKDYSHCGVSWIKSNKADIAVSHRLAVLVSYFRKSLDYA